METKEDRNARVKSAVENGEVDCMDNAGGCPKCKKNFTARSLRFERFCFYNVLFKNVGIMACTYYKTTIKMTLWPPCVADADIIFSSCGFFFLLLLFSSSNRSGRRVDVYHTSTHGVSLARNTGHKNDAKIPICAPSHQFVGLNLRN